MIVEKTRFFQHCATFLSIEFSFSQRVPPFILMNVFGLKKRLASVKLLFGHYETFARRKQLRKKYFLKKISFFDVSRWGKRFSSLFESGTEYPF